MRTTSPMRPLILARRGVVTSGHPLASAAGLGVLQEGGNAIDAAVAAAAVLTVVLPQACGLGGDVFALVAPSGETKVFGVNASGPSPGSANASSFPNGIPERGPLSVTVPGAVDGWSKILLNWGTMPLKRVLAPAIELAEEGFPVHRGLAQATLNFRELLKSDPEASRLFLPDGRPLQAGETLVQKDLALALRDIAEGGREAFYLGPIGRSLCQGLRALGGLLTEEDLAAYRCREVEPLRVPFRGYEALAVPPNSWGLLLLLQLRILEGFDLKGMGHNSAPYLHHLMGAQRLAFEAGRPHIADPDFVEIPLRDLLAEKRALELRQALGGGRAHTVADAGGDTSYVAAADAKGNAVSLMESVFRVFGSGVIPRGTGFFLNDRMCGFTLEPGHANELRPGKRPAHTLSPALVLKEGRPYLVLGSPGAAAQTVTLTQVLLNVLEFNLDLQAAVEAPRWSIDAKGATLLEEGVPEEVRRELEAMGHRPQVVSRGEPAPGAAKPFLIDPQLAFGSAKAVLIDEKTGTLMAAADHRREGYAMGW